MQHLYFNISAILLLMNPYFIMSQGHGSYDIGSYEPPDYTYRECIIVPDISINGIDSSHKSINALSSELHSKSLASGRYGLAPAHRLHLYTKRFEFGSLSFINASYTIDPLSRIETDNLFKSEKTFDKYSNASLTIGTNDSARMYHTPNVFFGATTSMGIFMENTKQNSGIAMNEKFGSLPGISYTQERTTMELINPSFSLFIGGGWGRIRDVTFGAVALNMLDRIKDVASQSAGIPIDGVQDFASCIERRRRLRTFDGRLAFIGAIDTLSQYLADKKAINGPNSAITMELADQWLYAFAQNRQAGLEFSLYPGIIAEYSKNVSSYALHSWRDSLDYDLHLNDGDIDNRIKNQSYQERSSYSHTYQTELTYCINSTFRAAKPIRRFFQISAQVDVNFHWNHYLARSVPSDLPETDYKKLLPLFQADASCLFAYYPNTRTTFSFTPNVSYERSFNYLINESKNHSTLMIVLKNSRNNDYRGIYVELPLTIVYYASPRLQYRISAASYFRKYYSSSESVIKSSYSTYSVDAGLTYQVF